MKFLPVLAVAAVAVALPAADSPGAAQVFDAEDFMRAMGEGPGDGDSSCTDCAARYCNIKPDVFRKACLAFNCGLKCLIN